MAVQEMPAFENGLGFMSCIKLMEYPDKIRTYLEGSFAEVFTDPWGDWDKILRVFGTFGTFKSQENASFAKYEDQGDSQKGPYFLSYASDGILVQMFEIAKKLGVLIDADDMEITYKVPPTPKEVENLTKWKSLVMQFEKIKDIETTMIVSAFAMGPLINSQSSLVRSPAQLKLYNSYLLGTTISMSEKFGGSTSESCVHKVPWDTTNTMFPDMVGTLTGDWWYNLIAEQIVDHEYEMIDAPLYYMTPADVSNNYFDFDNAGDNVVNVEYAIALPEDSTSDVSLELKTCYGVTFSQDLLYPCDGTLCDYSASCGNPEYINPSSIDFIIDNRLHWGSSSYAGQRVRIKYKKISIV